LDLKPTKGLKVSVNAKREAIFGDESVAIQEVALENGQRTGVMTGIVIAGYGEVEMAGLDGRRHWYPVEDLSGENGEKIVEEEIPVDMTDTSQDESDEEE